MKMIHEILKQTSHGSGRVGRKRQQKTLAILAAAAGLIEAEGLEGLTMQKLAARLDLAVGALYRYFPSKEALLARLQVQALGDYARLFQDAVDSLPDPPRKLPLVRLGLCAWLYALSAEHSPARFALISGATGVARELLGPVEGLQVLAAALPLFERFSAEFAAAEAACCLAPGDARDRALLWFTAVQGLLQARKLGRFSPGLYELERLLPELLKTLFLGWGASGEACDVASAKLQAYRQSAAFQSLIGRLAEPIGADPQAKQTSAKEEL